MALNIDICHICLDKKVELNKLSVCKNPECEGYICNKCWSDIYDNNIDKCPLCYIKLDENYEISKKNYSFEMSINVKKMISNIFAYLSFYSIGSSIMITIFYIINGHYNITNNINIHYYLISLIINPIFGFVIWYIILITLFRLVECVKNITEYDRDDSDDSDDSDIENQ